MNRRDVTDALTAERFARSPRPMLRDEETLERDQLRRRLAEEAALAVIARADTPDAQEAHQRELEAALVAGADAEAVAPS